VSRHFRPGLLRIHDVAPSMDNVVVDGVLDERSPALHADQALRIGFVFREQQ
jgi:hypothetical protein